jgi:hypothetical protein
MRASRSSRSCVKRVRMSLEGRRPGAGSGAVRCRFASPSWRRIRPCVLLRHSSRSTQNSAQVARSSFCCWRMIGLCSTRMLVSSSSKGCSNSCSTLQASRIALVARAQRAARGREQHVVGLVLDPGRLPDRVLDLEHRRMASTRSLPVRPSSRSPRSSGARRTARAPSPGPAPRPGPAGRCLPLEVALEQDVVGVDGPRLARAGAPDGVRLACEVQRVRVDVQLLGRARAGARPSRRGLPPLHLDQRQRRVLRVEARAVEVDPVGVELVGLVAPRHAPARARTRPPSERVEAGRGPARRGAGSRPRRAARRPRPSPG